MWFSLLYTVFSQEILSIFQKYVHFRTFCAYTTDKIPNLGTKSPDIFEIYHNNGHMSIHFCTFVYLPGNQMYFHCVIVQFSKAHESEPQMKITIL